MSSINTQLVLSDDTGNLFTTSLIIAERFGKRHTNVIQAIKLLKCSDDFSGLNFKPAEYVDDQGKPRPFYRVTRDGMAFLVMGFIGREASAWKERFIQAFNEMETSLREIDNSTVALPPSLLPQFDKAFAELTKVVGGMSGNVVQLRTEVNDIKEDLKEARKESRSEIEKISAQIAEISPRRNFTNRTKRMFNEIVLTRYRRACPCCQSVDILDEHNVRIEGVANDDHFFSKSKIHHTQGWVVCRDCNERLETERNDHEYAFKTFQKHLERLNNAQGDLFQNREASNRG